MSRLCFKRLTMAWICVATYANRNQINLGTVRAFSIETMNTNRQHTIQRVQRKFASTLSYALIILSFLGCVEGTPPMGEQSSKRNLNHFDGLVTFFVPGQDPQLSCSAVFLTPRILMTTATCVQFKTNQGEVGAIVVPGSSKALSVDTVYTLTTPNEPGDLALIRLIRPWSSATPFRLGVGAMPSTFQSRFVSAGCAGLNIGPNTEPVTLPVDSRGICPGGSGGVVYDTETRILHSMLSRSVQSDALDEYTDLLFYAERISDSIRNIMNAPELDNGERSTSPATEVTPTPTETQGENSQTTTAVEDICQTQQLYNNGVCDLDCAHPDPDCSQQTTSPSCEAAGEQGDGICPARCDSDPDCMPQTNNADPCVQQGLYNNGQCDTCPLLDPDCENQPERDTCERAGLYNNGRCDRCPEPDPDCEAEPAAEPEETDLCELFAAYGNGTCDPLCPRPDPDCQNSVSPSDSQGNTANGTASDGSGTTTPMEDANSDGDTDLCEVLGWYDDNECDTVCKRPDPACGP